VQGCKQHWVHDMLGVPFTISKVHPRARACAVVKGTVEWRSSADDTSVHVITCGGCEDIRRNMYMHVAASYQTQAAGAAQTLTDCSPAGRYAQPWGWSLQPLARPARQIWLNWSI
jgi:hypothetical protein